MKDEIKIKYTNENREEKKLEALRVASDFEMFRDDVSVTEDKGEKVFVVTSTMTKN